MFEKLWDLSFSFWQIGSFSIGGGYAIITLIEDLLVNRYHWLTMKEYTDIITISQMTPGPLAINASSFVGLKIAGFLGAVAATIQLYFLRGSHLARRFSFLLLPPKFGSYHGGSAGAEISSYRAYRFSRRRHSAFGPDRTQ